MLFMETYVKVKNKLEICFRFMIVITFGKWWGSGGKDKLKGASAVFLNSNNIVLKTNQKKKKS